MWQFEKLRLVRGSEVQEHRKKFPAPLSFSFGLVVFIHHNQYQYCCCMMSVVLVGLVWASCACCTRLFLLLPCLRFSGAQIVQTQTCFRHSGVRLHIRSTMLLCVSHTRLPRALPFTYEYRTYEGILAGIPALPQSRPRQCSVVTAVRPEFTQSLRGQSPAVSYYCCVRVDDKRSYDISQSRIH